MFRKLSSRKKIAMFALLFFIFLTIPCSLLYAQKQEFSPEKIRQMEQVFKSSPIEAQNILKHLKNPDFLRDGSYRYAIFVGIPGSGKTTMAQAIAYKAGWQVEFIASGDIIGDKRNQTMVELRYRLNEIVQRGQPVVVIIDELNELLENSASEHHDTSATAKFLWQFLDKQADNHKFFLIGTMNRDDKLPQAFKSRIFQNRIEFSSPINPTYKRKVFYDTLLTNGYVQLHESIDDKYIDEQLKKLSSATGRDLNNFASLVKRVCRKYDNVGYIMVIDKRHIEEAVALHIHNHHQVAYTSPEETDAERQERHFVQRELIENFIRLNMTTEYDANYNGVVKSTKQTLSEAQKAELNALMFSELQLPIALALLERSAKIRKEKEQELAAKKQQ